MHNEKIEKSEITTVNNPGIVSSGRTPKDSGPHSFKRACQTLKSTPLLISGVLTKRLSMSRGAMLIRLSAGCLLTSVNR